MHNLVHPEGVLEVTAIHPVAQVLALAVTPPGLPEDREQAKRLHQLQPQALLRDTSQNTQETLALHWGRRGRKKGGTSILGEQAGKPLEKKRVQRKSMVLKIQYLASLYAVCPQVTSKDLESET